jgi:transcriptional regulator with XRE-family HTH domain
MAMGDHGDRFKGIDQHIAANLRTYREAENISQEDLAQRMADRGFGFSQATIWKIESGQRPVKASELIALADSLGDVTVASLTGEPGTTRYLVQLDQANHRAYKAYTALKEAAEAYLEAQLNVLFAAQTAHEAGLTITERHAPWLTTPPEEVVIETRAERAHEADYEDQVNADVNQVLNALHSSGYKPVLEIGDITLEQGQ